MLTMRAKKEIRADLDLAAQELDAQGQPEMADEIDRLNYEFQVVDPRDTKIVEMLADNLQRLQADVYDLERNGHGPPPGRGLEGPPRDGYRDDREARREGQERYPHQHRGPRDRDRERYLYRSRDSYEREQRMQSRDRGDRDHREDYRGYDSHYDRRGHDLREDRYRRMRADRYYDDRDRRPFSRPWR